MQCLSKHFDQLCRSLGSDPFSCSPAIIVKYLRLRFEQGTSYSSVNLCRLAISKFHVGYHGKPIGEHPLVGQAVRAVFRLRPPLPKYKTTFDVKPVLDYVASLTPLDSLDLKTLTLKTFFLVTYTFLSRVSSIARLMSEVETCKVGSNFK